MHRKNCLETILNPAPVLEKPDILPSLGNPLNPNDRFSRLSLEHSVVQIQVAPHPTESLQREVYDYRTINGENIGFVDIKLTEYLSNSGESTVLSNMPISPLAVRRPTVKRGTEYIEPSRQRPKRHKHVPALDSDEVIVYRTSRSATPGQEANSPSETSSQASLVDEEEYDITLRSLSAPTNVVASRRNFGAPYSSSPHPDDDSSADEVVDSRNVITCHFGSCTAVINTLHSPLGYHLNERHKPDAQDRNGNIACQWDSCGTQVKWRNLRRHIMESHLGSLSKECSGCSKMFSRSDALKRHQKHYCGGKKVPAQAGLGSEGVKLNPRHTFSSDLLEPIPPTGRSVGRGRGRTPPRQRSYKSSTPSGAPSPYSHQDQRDISSNVEYPNPSSPPHRTIPPPDHIHHYPRDDGRPQVDSSRSTSYERYPPATPAYSPRPILRPTHDPNSFHPHLSVDLSQHTAPRIFQWRHSP